MLSAVSFLAFLSGFPRGWIVVDGFLAKWISLIESEKGLTRMKIRRYMPAMHVRARMVGDVSPAQVVKAVRWHALSLINCGYTPKWLDEEFPLPEGEKDLWEK